MSSPYNLSIKEKIVQSIADSLLTIKEGLPIATPYPFTFGDVQRQPLDPSQKGKEYCVAIFDQDETKIPDFNNLMRCTIHLVLELLVFVKANENPSTKVNMVLAATERRIMEDVTCGGNAIDITFTRAEQSIGGKRDYYCECALFFDVSYRHLRTDPSRRV